MELEEYQPLRSALKKLGDAALKAVEGERGQTGQLSESDAIQGGEMDADALDDLLRTAFRVRLAPAELGALIVLFDRDTSGTVSTAEFFAMFHRVGVAERDARKRRHHEETARRAQTRADWTAEQVRRFAGRNKARLPKARSAARRERDAQAALEKLAVVAATFDKDRGPGLLDGLQEARAMTPTHFRDQLRINFNLRLPASQVRGAAPRARGVSDPRILIIARCPSAPSNPSARRARRLLRRRRRRRDLVPGVRRLLPRGGHRDEAAARPRAERVRAPRRLGPVREPHGRAVDAPRLPGV